MEMARSASALRPRGVRVTKCAVRGTVAVYGLAGAGDVLSVDPHRSIARKSRESDLKALSVEQNRSVHGGLFP
jgi:hypothetical protein